MQINQWESLSVLDLWKQQVLLHHGETYKGIPIVKFPQDLWTYEKIIGDYKPEIIIELGVDNGGFTRWLYDRMLLLQLESSTGPRTVIGIDYRLDAPRKNLSSIVNHKEKHDVSIMLLNCNLASGQISQTATKLKDICKGKRVMIIEDSAHNYQTTKSCITNLANLVPVGGWWITEDTCVDFESLRQNKNWPRGALTATEELLGQSSQWELSKINHQYVLTCHPNGFYRRIG